MTWREVAEALALQGIPCAAFDLPGFGREADSADFGIEETVEAVIATIQMIRDERERPWILAGHSMGGKFAAIVARAAIDGREGLENLKGLVLVSPSPPGPEPMSESTREQMIESLGYSTQVATTDREHAEKFVDDNTGKLPLVAAVRDRAVEDVLRMNREAFVAWLTTGSKEDWSARVGVIALPTLIVAGTDESALGPEAQREHTLPHFPEAKIAALEGGGHLAPLERPEELAERIVLFLRSVGFENQWPSLDPTFRMLINSELTSPQTREVMMQRINDHVGRSGILSEEEFLTLHAAGCRILPGCPFDLASRIERWLSLPQHDGWRHDTLPSDVDAWRIGLRSLRAAAVRKHGVPFSALDEERQNALLLLARQGELGKSLLGSLHVGDEADLFTGAQMRDWFGDLSAELTKIYMADPRTMQRVGFTGFADEQGFHTIRLQEQEEFEG